MTSETPFEQTTELVSEPGNELNTIPWKTRRNDIVHTNLLALKLHRKITSFLVDIQAETAAQNATENASPDSHMRQWSDQVNQYRTTSNLHMKLTHLKTIHGHNQMCKRRNQAAVTNTANLFTFDLQNSIYLAQVKWHHIRTFKNNMSTDNRFNWP